MLLFKTPREVEKERYLVFDTLDDMATALRGRPSLIRKIIVVRREKGGEYDMPPFSAKTLSTFIGHPERVVRTLGKTMGTHCQNYVVLDTYLSRSNCRYAR